MVGCSPVRVEAKVAIVVVIVNTLTVVTVLGITPREIQSQQTQQRIITIEITQQYRQT